MIAGTTFRLANLEEVWPRYAARAERSRAGAQHLEWVRKQCRKKAALCLECDDGIVVFTLRGKTVKALMAVGLAGSFRRRTAEFDAILRDLGADSVTFCTDRVRAWRRILGPGWAFDGEDRFLRAA